MRVKDKIVLKETLERDIEAARENQVTWCSRYPSIFNCGKDFDRLEELMKQKDILEQQELEEQRKVEKVLYSRILKRFQ